jgi:pyroglutamyl-peptidase
MKLLFTSFDTWEPHQRSNASDDLLQAILDRNLCEQNWHFLRRIPVDFDLAPNAVISKIQELQPDITLCCGMAENRERLSIESNGKSTHEIVHTKLPVAFLLEGTLSTDISHDAGNFVCNHLYYSVLKHSEKIDYRHQCLFIHVPTLNEHDIKTIVQDFLSVIQKVKLHSSSTQ